MYHFHHNYDKFSNALNVEADSPSQRRVRALLTAVPFLATDMSKTAYCWGGCPALQWAASTSFLTQTGTQTICKDA